MNKTKLTRAACMVALVCSTQTHSAGVSGLVEEIVVKGAQIEQSNTEVTEAASVGTVYAHQLEHRPILRPAEVLETVPGMVVTQHSGGGKANQYFLRGFNLDHSTDFASHFEGAPVNMVSHGHGQGYTDLNFLIPEMIDRMNYKKGPYYASEGDFSSAGAASIVYARKKDSNQIKLQYGGGNYRRALLHGGYTKSDLHWVYALERTTDDGPWVNPDDLVRNNAFLKLTKGNQDNGVSASVMMFNSNWSGTDQVPQFLVTDHNFDRFGTLDPSTGGDTHRHQVSFSQWADINERSQIKSSAYFVDYELSLSGNFTYFLGDNDKGDQITQFDNRQIMGGNIEWRLEMDKVHALSVGLDLRHDDISNVGVGQSQNRVIHNLLKRAEVRETSAGLYASVHSQWTDWLATIMGARYDHFDVDVDDKKDQDSGVESDSLLTPKLSLRLGPFSKTEFFINYGQGFHSNDVRGVVKDSEVPLLAPSMGYEVGVSTSEIEKLQINLVLFSLELDSELVFVGDDGTIEPKDGTRRRGLELSLYYQPVDWLVLDADYTKAQARFKELQFEPAVVDDTADILLGDYVPDSIEDVFSMGLSLDMSSGVYAGLRLRYFGPRNLTESGTIRSKSTALVNANFGYRFRSGLSIGLEVLNLADRSGDDITYWYASKPFPDTEGGPVCDSEAACGHEPGYHSHPMAPREARATITYEF